MGINKTKKDQISDFSDKNITRKEAIKKTGYMALSTATMMILLNKNVQGKPKTSCAEKQGNNGWGNGNQNAPGNSGGNNNAENGPNNGNKNKNKNKNNH